MNNEVHKDVNATELRTFKCYLILKCAFQIFSADMDEKQVLLSF